MSDGMPGDEAPTENPPRGNGSDLEAVVIPQEVLDLLRFMCATWSEVDRFVYQHCDGDALMHYPVVQGMGNQIRLQRIGEQPHNTANIRKAVEWMQRYNAEFNGPHAQSEAARMWVRCNELL